MRTSQRDLSAEWRCRTKASCAGREQEPLGGDPQWDPQWDPCSAQDPFQTHVKIKIAATVSFKDEILCDQVLKLGLAFGVRNSRIPDTRCGLPVGLRPWPSQLSGSAGGGGPEWSSPWG